MQVSAVIFTLITLVTFGWAGKQFYRVWKNIHLGKPETISGHAGQRWRNVILVALGQQKMFKRFIPAILHLFIYAAFLLTQVELIEIFVDGFFGVHRFFAVSLGSFYTFVIGLIEILSALALIATIVFLFRRNILRLSRFWKPEMTSWPRLDANLILLAELILVVAILTMNSADTVLQSLDPGHYPYTGYLPVSGWLGPALFGGMAIDDLVLIERTGWWLHVLVVFGFIVYLPFSKHLHIFLAFPCAWFSKTRSRGEMAIMPEVMREVRSMLGVEQEPTPPGVDHAVMEFGAKDITGLSWRNILEAYSCTECGRCTAVCPANITGKKLSPRKIMMDIRDRTEEVSKKILQEARLKKSAGQENEIVDAHQALADDGSSLFDRITAEEIYACTACNACVEACPVLIDPLEPILQMRRYQILMESKGPSEWMPMFNSLESSGSVWQVPEARSKWVDLLK